MKRGVLLAVLAALALAAPAQAVQTITVINETGHSRYGMWTVRQVEQALVIQARQLHAAWGTPLIRFGRGGWPLMLVKHETTYANSLGYHEVAYTPYAVVQATSHDPLWPQDISHELMEMLVNPFPKGDVFGRYGWQKEVCDPTDGSGYTLLPQNIIAPSVRGVPLEDFVTPAWFTGGHGPYDHMRLMQQPGTSLTGDRAS